MIRQLASILLATLLSPLAFAAAPATPSPLVGTWRFVKEVDTRPNGTVVHPGSGKGYQGLMVYTASGLVTVTVMPKGRMWRIDTAEPVDLRETVETGTAYYGRYEVDPGRGVVTHFVDGAMDPESQGRRLVRNYRFVGRDLVLSGTWFYGGHSLRFEITWERVE